MIKTMVRAAFWTGVALTITLAVVGAGLVGYSHTLAHASAPAHRPHFHIGVPPYWHEDPPKDCNEDMICWIGSNEDGRSADAAYRDWRHQMHSLAQTRASSIVGVFLDQSDTDGNPLEVARGGISKVHGCKGHGDNRTCIARLDGYNKWIFVAGVDFPGHHPRHAQGGHAARSTSRPHMPHHPGGCDHLGMTIHQTDICRHNRHGGENWIKSPCWYLPGDGIAIEWCGQVAPARIIK